MADPYATLEELKATLNMDGLDFADDDLTLALAAASRGIDQLAGRRFYPDEDANQTRYYTPDDPCVLSIDDVVTVSSVATDPAGDGTFGEAWTQNTDYVLEPLNAAADGEPWTRLHVHPFGNYRWPCHVPRSVRVTGMFGWTEAPVGIKQATVVLASKLLRRAREAPFGVISVGLEDSGVMRIARTDPDVMFLVGPYVRRARVI